MAGDEGEMSVGTEVLFSNVRWSSGMGSPSLPAHRDPPVSLPPPPGCFSWAVSGCFDLTSFQHLP